MVKHSEVPYAKREQHKEHYPNLAIDPEDQVDVGKYSQMRRGYLKEHRPGLFGALWIEGKLTPHLLEINDTAFVQINLIVRQLLKAYPVPDRSVDHMAYVEHMNSLTTMAEEIVLHLRAASRLWVAAQSILKEFSGGGLQKCPRPDNI